MSGKKSKRQPTASNSKSEIRRKCQKIKFFAACLQTNPKKGSTFSDIGDIPLKRDTTQKTKLFQNVRGALQKGLAVRRATS
jgi:hypothetical protein